MMVATATGTCNDKHLLPGRICWSLPKLKCSSNAWIWITLNGAYPQPDESNPHSSIQFREGYI